MLGQWRYEETYIRGVEDVRKEEVEQCPELVEVVLQGSTSQQETVGGTKLSYNLRQLHAKEKNILS